MRPADASQIRSVHLFREMADDRFAALVRNAYLQRFPAEFSLVVEHKKPDFLHVVVEGAVELFSHHIGRETTIAVRRPVTTFMLAAVVRDLPCLASARTLEPSRVLVLPAEVVRKAFDEDNAFARAIVRELSTSFRSVIKELKGQKLRTSAERLANWILIHDARNGGHGHFVLPYEKRTLASRLGMRPENLSRNFARLAAYGVTVNRNEIRLRGRSKLEAYANRTPSIDDCNY